MGDIASITPFPQFKTTGDDKHDVEVFIEDQIDYCMMQNWFDPFKETEAAKWTKPENAIGISSSIVFSCSQSILQIQSRIIRTGSEKTAHGYQRPERLRSNHRSLGGKAEIYFLSAK